jgi:hypothetical protein
MIDKSDPVAYWRCVNDALVEAGELNRSGLIGGCFV